MLEKAHKHVLTNMTPNKAKPRRMSIISMRSLAGTGRNTAAGSPMAVGIEACSGMALPCRNMAMAEDRFQGDREPPFTAGPHPIRPGHTIGDDDQTAQNASSQGFDRRSAELIRPTIE